MCVVGQFMIDPSNYKWEGASIDHILEQNLQDDVFKPEAVGILNIGEWRILQRIHDIIAVNEKRNFTSVLKKDIEFLDIFTFDELVEFSQN